MYCCSLSLPFPREGYRSFLPFTNAFHYKSQDLTSLRRLDDLFYVEDSKHIPSQLSPRSSPSRFKLPRHAANNFKTLRSPAAGGHRVIRSARECDGAPGNATEEEENVQAEVLKAASAARETRKEQCRQVVLSCAEEKCGKAPLYFFSKVMSRCGRVECGAAVGLGHTYEESG